MLTGTVVWFSSLPHCQQVTVSVNTSQLFIHISCCVQVMSKLQEIAKHYVGLWNVGCAVLYVVGKHRVLSYRKNSGLWVSESGVQVGVFGCEGGEQQEISDNYIIRSFVVCICEQILLGWKNGSGQGLWHVRGIWWMCTGQDTERSMCKC